MDMVYVLNKDGKPLMATTRGGRVRYLLKEKKARVVSRTPFTIQLNYDTPDVTQDLILGVDPGRTNIGVAVVKENGSCVFSAHLETRNKELPLLMKKRAVFRKQHRNLDRRRKRQRRAKAAGTAIAEGSIERLPVILLCLALLVVIGALVYTLRAPEDTKPNVPAPEDSPNVTVVEDELSQEEPERSEEISLIYTDNAKIELSTGKITMYFKNPSTCSHDVILELYVLSGEESVKIATSDLIIAGQDLTTMKMETTATKLSEGNYTGMYRLLFFEPGEKITDPPAQESKITDVSIVVTK